MFYPYFNPMASHYGPYPTYSRSTLYPIPYMPYPYPVHSYDMETRQATDFQHGPERIITPHTNHVDWSAKYPNDIFVHGPEDRREVALTFDDGPDNEWTPQVLDVLDRYKIKGTFMCVGRRVAENQKVLKRMVKDGHIVGNHTWNHPNVTLIPISEVRSQIEKTANEIHRVAGVRPQLFRPPYGALNDEVIKEMISLKNKIIFWSVDSLDWAKLTGPQVAANVLAHARPGSIVLQHSAGGRGQSLANTVQALPYIIETLREEGYSFVTVSQMLKLEPYEMTTP